MIKEDLLENLPTAVRKFVITPKEDIPEQVHLGQKSWRNNLMTTQEEADVLISRQVIAAATDGNSSSKVLCDDTDVFALLCHYYHAQQWEFGVFMEGFKEGKSVISIKESVQRNIDINPQILSMHALTGCDSAPMMYGMGKKRL